MWALLMFLRALEKPNVVHDLYNEGSMYIDPSFKEASHYRYLVGREYTFDTGPAILTGQFADSTTGELINHVVHLQPNGRFYYVSDATATTDVPRPRFACVLPKPIIYGSRDPRRPPVACDPLNYTASGDPINDFSNNIRGLYCLLTYDNRIILRNTLRYLLRCSWLNIKSQSTGDKSDEYYIPASAVMARSHDDTDDAVQIKYTAFSETELLFVDTALQKLFSTLVCLFMLIQQQRTDDDYYQKVFICQEYDANLSPQQALDLHECLISLCHKHDVTLIATVSHQGRQSPHLHRSMSA
jgi:hypothetical protein